jgi:site-specific recombinase XerD
VPASRAIADFERHLARSGLSATTVRIREHFLTEYRLHVQQAAGPADITVTELLSPDRLTAWLDDAVSGRTRTRNTLHGREADAHRNSMRVRIDSFNAFAEFLGVPDRLDTQQPEPGDSLSPDSARKLLHMLAVRRPVHANAATALRTAAVAALVAATGRTVPELAGLNVRDIHLETEPKADIVAESCPLGPEAAQVLGRWLDARAVITAELEGSDPGYLWIPTKPGRPRGGRPPVKPGLSRAAVRTLHHGHRTLVSQLLGSPMRPGTLRILHEDLATAGQPVDASAP